MPRLIQDLAAQHAQDRPDRTAVVWKGDRLTYGELESTTNRLARLLRESGCKPGARVAFCLPKSPEALVTMIGTLKADCVYVPIDTECPASRVAKVIESCRPDWVIANHSSSRLVDEVFADRRLTKSIKVASVDETSLASENFGCECNRADLQGFSPEPLSYRNQSRDPAHILFTSGSTGTPKGVVITHANVLAFVEWGVRYFGINDSDRVSGHAPLHFDLSTFDVYGAFAAGAELYPVPPELNLLPNKLADFIRITELTQWFSVPSILNYMYKFNVVEFGDFPSLKRLMWCGEVLPTPTLTYLMRRLPTASFSNLYGPTEATIASSYYTVDECPARDTDAVPIGQACHGENLFVLDAELKPVPTGEIGDLFIGGAGLSPGYWQDADKTEAVFLKNPNSPDGNSRIYKTGDLARVDEHGLVWFLGRADTQIKSRGYRIELGEIEAALNSLGYLGESAVVAIDTDGFENKAICCAYVPSQNASLTVAQVRTELLNTIPKYMLPTNWLEFDQLPKNANGKIDRPQLRKCFGKAAQHAKPSQGKQASSGTVTV